MCHIIVFVEFSQDNDLLYVNDNSLQWISFFYIFDTSHEYLLHLYYRKIESMEKIKILSEYIHWLICLCPGTN